MTLFCFDSWSYLCFLSAIERVSLGKIELTYFMHLCQIVAELWFAAAISIFSQNAKTPGMVASNCFPTMVFQCDNIPFYRNLRCSNGVECWCVWKIMPCFHKRFIELLKMRIFVSTSELHICNVHTQCTTPASCGNSYCPNCTFFIHGCEPSGENNVRTFSRNRRNSIGHYWIWWNNLP